MRRVLFILIITALFTQCAPEKSFTIKGNITGFTDGTVVALQSVDDAIVVDETTIENNSFTFYGSSGNEPENYMIVIMDGDDPKFYTLFMGNEDITVTGDKSEFPYNLKVTGSAYHEKALALYPKLTELYHKRNKIEKEFFALTPEQQEKDSINDLYWGEKGKASLIDLKMDSIRADYVKNNLNTPFALDQLKLSLHMFSKAEIRSMYSSLSPELQADRRAKAAQDYAAAENVAVGKKVPDFSGFDMDNKKHTLYGLIKNKKYTLINFTTPHCGYCTLSLPDIKKVQVKYKENLQVVSLTIDKNIESWKKESKENDVTWHNLITREGRYSKPVMQYKVYGTPTFFLVDSQGKLLHTWSGRKENLEKEFVHLLL